LTKEEKRFKKDDWDETEKKGRRIFFDQDFGLKVERNEECVKLTDSLEIDLFQQQQKKLIKSSQFFSESRHNVIGKGMTSHQKTSMSKLLNKSMIGL